MALGGRVYQQARGTCPKCEKLLSSITATSASQDASLRGKGYDAVLYTCPFCAAILGSGIDPTAVAYDAIDEIVRRLGAALRGDEKS